MRLDEWTNRDSRQRVTLGVTATDVVLLGGGRQDEPAEDGRDPANNPAAPAEPHAVSDELPFYGSP